jgi:hypothetical protein
MESQAKHAIHCDCCKTAIALPSHKPKAEKGAKKPVEPEPLEAVMKDGLGNEKTCHFCDEECLRVFLNARRKKAKASVELDISNNTFKKVVIEV